MSAESCINLSQLTHRRNIYMHIYPHVSIIMGKSSIEASLLKVELHIGPFTWKMSKLIHVCYIK